jgi:hypothetical protein
MSYNLMGLQGLFTGIRLPSYLYLLEDVILHVQEEDGHNSSFSLGRDRVN